MKQVSLENLSAYHRQLKARYAQKSELPTAVSQLSNDSGFQTEAQVAAAVAAKVSSVYRAGGSAAFAALPDLSAANLGLVINVTDAFVTTDSFIEGAGKSYPAGTNVAVVQAGETYQYDVLAGFVDLSGYVKASDMEAITEAEIEALFADESV